MSAERDVRGANFVFFGGSTGIGYYTALEVARRGANVLIVGRGREAGEAAVANVAASGATSADFVAGDLSTVAGITKVVAEVKGWRSELHGIMHSAMSASNYRRRTVTSEGLEFNTALQGLARPILTRLLIDELVASGDGRAVHLQGNPPLPRFFQPNLDDLNWERRRWTFFRSVLPSHLLNFLFAQEAAIRWADLPVTTTVACVGPTKDTKVVDEKNSHPVIRALAKRGAHADIVARNAVRVMTAASAHDVNGAVFRSWKSPEHERIAMDPNEASRFWEILEVLAAERGAVLP